MRFKMIERYNDDSIGEHIYSQSKIKAKVLESIDIGCVRTIDVYAIYGKKVLGKVFHFKRIGKLAPWQMNKKIKI